MARLARISKTIQSFANCGASSAAFFSRKASYLRQNGQSLALR